MAKSKSNKRKRNATALNPQKIAKPSNAIVTVLSEPKRLETLISEEELEITIDTLTALAQYPSLIKSKFCKDLRAAVYDFRQSCTTGVNSAEAANLTGKITGALADEKYLEARVLLAEMRIRGEAPSIGALCRWVRDLDVTSGMSIKPLQTGPDATERSARDKNLLGVLDAVMRVSCPVDKNPEPKIFSPSSFPIAFQPLWDLRPVTEPLEVYASVLDKSIFASAPQSLPSSLRVIERTPALQRKPPNHYDAILYTSANNTIPLSPDHPPVTYHTHPNVPNLSLASNVLSPDECKAIIAAGESVTFVPDSPLREGEDVSILAHNFYWVIDTVFHDALWKRVSHLVPSSVNGRLARGINRRFRVYRYVPGAEYRLHIDGAWPPSGILPDDTYVYDASPAEKKQSSMFTFLIYLNDEFEGGETTFLIPAATDGVLNAYPVRPVMGSVAVFPHGEDNGALLHEGTGVRKGAKYIIRTEIEYDVDA